ncbi:protein SEMI-ROLLED LEAF 2 isoform X1 [Typha angustifolia]|uniref:protein SEMI-ROLLED LEAF 2 isoform X1 n=1 Tax=Typha angustifolia TaxID=59011 RepID=UPI003C3052ED
MGFISRKLFPSCGSMCVCCPALRPSSRRPVKRYKKLLAEIFPKTLDGPLNERKIMKLCEYAAKNPLRIPKIAKFLEQRSHKELRAGHVNFVMIITEAYNKLLYICKEQMAYFAVSLLNVIMELLDSKQQDAILILGCKTLTRFIYSQADNTYARNIESLVCKVCNLAREHGEEHDSLQQAASLQCLSAMVWFMTEYSYIFSDFDEIVHSILENYRIDEPVDGDDARHVSHHNWVDEVVRCEARTGVIVGSDVSPSHTAMRLRPTTNNSSNLTSREERESPEVWSHICIQKLAELAKESTTMRRILDPMLIYFDTERQWAPRHGLALLVLSDMCLLEKISGNEQLILAATIRHLDHKNVVHDPQIKSDIIQTSTSLARQLRSRGIVADIVIVSDLCRHLRKSLQATVESAGLEESNLNESLQNSIEDCLLEIVKGINDVRPLFDMMTITLENLLAVAAVARATMGSLLILSHIISLTSIYSHPQMVFPEALLLQLLKSMMHPDIETRLGAHQIFSAILIRAPNHPRSESEYLYESKKWQSRTTSVFASATALLEKLRREKESLNADKNGNVARDEIKERKMCDEECKSSWARKNSSYFCKLGFSVVDRIATSTNFTDMEANIITLSEDQAAQLLSSFWIQANKPDNLPSNFEAIAHSFSLTLISYRLKNSSHSNTLRVFQLPLSLRNASLDPNGMLPPPCQRSLFTLATSMLAFAGKIYHITELTESLKFFTSSNFDPYLRIAEDLQLYVRLQADLNEYGSDNDEQAARSTLVELKKNVFTSEEHLVDIIARALSNLTNLESDVLSRQLSETFLPEDVPLFGSNPALEWVNNQALAYSEESLSFDEECSRASSVDGEMAGESPVTDIPKFIPRMPTPSVPQVTSVGELLESALHVAGQVAGASVSTSPLPYGAMTSQCEALGMGTRKKLSSWLVSGHDSTHDNTLPVLPMGQQFGIQRANAYCFERDYPASSEPWMALRLPPASPFDNFLKAAGY